MYEIYLFYSGHGHENGDWAIETVEEPLGDRLSLEELAEIWTENRASKKSHLFVFMDSCYSGSWCVQVADMEASLNINVVSSCAKDQRCKDINNIGGLLNLCILSTNDKFLSRDSKLLFHHQTPFYFLSKMERAKRLQEGHIVMLQKAITNAKRLN